MQTWSPNLPATSAQAAPPIGVAHQLPPQPLPARARSGALDLVLWRHAEAEPAAEAGDLERRLSRKGRRQADRMAGWLNRHLPEGTRVLVSPARRAIETAEALGRNFKPRAELGPLAGEQDVLGLLGWASPDGPKYKGPVLVIGHHTWLAPLAARLLGMPPGNLSFRKGAVWWIRSRTAADGAVRTGVVASLAPDLVGGV